MEFKVVIFNPFKLKHRSRKEKVKTDIALETYADIHMEFSPDHARANSAGAAQNAFCHFYEEGSFRKEYFAGEYDFMIDALHMAIAYWASFSSLQKSIGVNMEYRRHAWSIIYHLLTEKGRVELKSIIQI